MCGISSWIWQAKDLTKDLEQLETSFSNYNVSRESVERLKIYVETLVKWQNKINLIGLSTKEDIWNRHIIDSLQVLEIIQRQNRNLKIIDLGTGAGIPGIILAIARPTWQIHLVESNSKKVAFLYEVARLTNIKPQIHLARIENLDIATRVDFDWVMSRALAPLPELLELSYSITRKAKALFHKGQDVDVEVDKATISWDFNFKKHQSVVNSNSYILEISEISRQSNDPN